MQKYFRNTKEDHSQKLAFGHNWWTLFSLAVETLGLLGLKMKQRMFFLSWVQLKKGRNNEQINISFCFGLCEKECFSGRTTKVGVGGSQWSDH